MVIALEEAWALSLVPPAIWLNRVRTYQQAVLLRGRIFVWIVRTSWLSEIFAWSRVQQKVSGCQGHQSRLASALWATPLSLPNRSTLLPQLDVSALEALLSRWVRATLVAKPDDPVALDGKAIRGARTGEQSAPHLLSFRTHHSQETLVQTRVDDKTNEIPVAQAVLPFLLLPGRIYTADAMHTQVNWMQVIHLNQAFTVLTVKENQPNLFQDLQTYFADQDACCAVAETWDRGRGRVEHRSIRGSHEMNAYLNPMWPYIRQVAEVTRMVTQKQTTSKEVAYLITDLSSTQASPERLLAVVRGHWSIENGSH